MTFLSPDAAVWALWAAPILLFYAWHVRSPRYRVSTGHLWAQVFSAARPRSRWQRWRHPASLAVQLLIAVTLVAALTQPCLWLPAPISPSTGVADVGNLGITRLAARRDPVEPTRCQVLVEVASQANRTARCRIDFELDGRSIGASEIELKPGDRWHEVYQLTSRDGGELTARLARPDGSVDDNSSAALQLPPSGMRPVILVERENGALRRALESNPRVELTVGDTPPLSMDTNALLVLNGCVVNQFPDTATLVVNPVGSCPWWELGEVLPDAVVSRQDENSPLLANVSLLGLRLAGARRLTLTDKARPLARAIAWAADGSPLAYEIARKEGCLVVFSGGVESGDLGERAALPILMANAAACLGRDATRQAGDVSPWRELSPVVQAGNVLPAREGDPHSSATAPKIGTGSGPPAPVMAPLWHYLVVAAFLMLVLEWILYQRRWIC